MERDKEITKLVNVLHRIARAAMYTAWNNAGPDAARFCASQYNKVLRRLSELEPAVAQLFTPLAEDASPEVARLAAAELAAYFEDEQEGGRRSHRAWRCGNRVWAGWAGAPGRCR
jgi:predicted negative regulator of RcsB-dependent stress response